MASFSQLPRGLVLALTAAEYVVILTGAGISAESGIPTFRDAQTGLWSRYDPHELATPQAFAANPRLVWEWYEWRRGLIAGAQPNAGHLAIAALQRKLPRCTLITQNVDGLHQLAGSRDVLELHGNIERTICSAEGVVVADWSADLEVPPRCPQCGAYLRPDVVWFGESLPPRVINAAIDACNRCDLFLAVGTSAVVQPAASLAHLAAEHGAQVVEVNSERTPLTPYADFSLLGKAGELLPALARLIDQDDSPTIDLV
ncbi:MAG: SIR2 family NAD-dependent protein deacylase [Candidatus Promineifilaceae bacterium]